MISSMSRKGNCNDNACTESFYSVIKRELVQSEEIQNTDIDKSQVRRYIDALYNRQPIHSLIDYKTPGKYWAMHERTHNAAS